MEAKSHTEEEKGDSQVAAPLSPRSKKLEISKLACGIIVL
jgi:hypothetical protein